MTLFFLSSSAEIVLAASDIDRDISLGSYVTKMIIALLVFSAAGYALARYLPGGIGRGAVGKLRLVAALSLGRDMLYIVRTGPQVVALFVGRSSSTVVGRWSAEEWDDYEAAAAIAGWASGDARAAGTQERPHEE
ncbi:MAG: hypothetical protein LBS75_07155 [Synergistaceae bacterium]|nr:hypothetical protein [Synergistaceae bacterium]